MSTNTARPVKGEPSEQERERGKAFGLWLREARARKGWNKRELANASNVSDTYIGVLEADGINKSTGQYQRPSEDKVRALAEALGADENAGRAAAGYSAEVVSFPHKRLSLRTGDIVDFYGIPGLSLNVTDELLLRLETEAQIQKRRGQVE